MQRSQLRKFKVREEIYEQVAATRFIDLLLLLADIPHIDIL